MADPADDFAEFVSARYRGLVQTAFLLVGDRQLAEDLVQSALYRTYLSWSRLAAPATASSYTRTTMVRLAGRWAMRRSATEVVGLGARSELSANGDDVGLAVDVRRALAALPLQQRAVIVLRYFDDLSEADTAAVLGCSVGTVKSRASRALARLRDDGLLVAEPDSEGR